MRESLIVTALIAGLIAFATLGVSYAQGDVITSWAVERLVEAGE